MNYTFKNLTLRMSLGDADLIGDCRFQIPFEEKQGFLKDCCGMLKTGNQEEHEPVFSHQYGEIYIDRDDMYYYSTSPDLLIAYMSYLLDSGKDEIIYVDYTHYYWGIHDSLHALNDEAGCTIYVDGEIERERLIDGFKIFTDQGYYCDDEMLREIEEAFQERFKMPIDLVDQFRDTRFDYDWDDEE